MFRKVIRLVVLVCGWGCLLSVQTCCADVVKPPSSINTVPSLGYAELEQADHGKTIVFYPSSSPEQAKHIGPFELSFAKDGLVTQGNGHLIVISHGSGALPPCR